MKNLDVPKRNAKVFTFNLQDAQTTTTSTLNNDIIADEESPI